MQTCCFDCGSLDQRKFRPFEGYQVPDRFFPKGFLQTSRGLPAGLSPLLWGDGCPRMVPIFPSGASPRFYHGCCWDTFCMFAYCGLVVEIPTSLLKLIFFLLPFQRQPRNRLSLPGDVRGNGTPPPAVGPTRQNQQGGQSTPVAAPRSLL